MSQTAMAQATALQWNLQMAGLHMADDKLYKSEAMGSGTFIITKPKRKSRKLRQSRLKAPKAGARK
jgi:hypothetical protein